MSRRTKRNTYKNVIQLNCFICIYSTLKCNIIITNVSATLGTHVQNLKTWDFLIFNHLRFSLN